jgi:enamine deaminase RidA (YjgF/YER057c/UK114 family)
MKIDAIHPDGWKPARGYANALRVEDAQTLLFVAGQVAWDAEQRIVGPGDFAAQFAQALENVLACVRAAGGEPRHVVRMTIYVTDKRQYMAATRAIGERWRALLGRHYPAMSLVQVADLLEEGALVEIEATAAW